MQLIQKVTIKQVLTEKTREKMLNDFHSRINQLQKECDQLRFAQKVAEKQHKGKLDQVRASYEREIAIREDKIKQIGIQIDQLHILPVGSELKEREMQTMIDVEVGDSWEATEGKTIVVKDGVIIEIR
ncbi:MAG TPA: YlqD family protein [Chondromyces sp.]|nr:YlqD family protein [Chondromyces sp.]